MCRSVLCCAELSGEAVDQTSSAVHIPIVST